MSGLCTDTEERLKSTGGPQTKVEHQRMCEERKEGETILEVTAAVT